ncbi:MAG: VanZ family protein [Ectothiorhodospiraceae bacterium]|nr:VanZ family protein [Ectothiorhodospiraceae bacterium]
MNAAAGSRRATLHWTARLARPALWAMVGVVAWLSMSSVESLPPIRIWDKAAHLIAYAAIGGAAVLAYPAVRGGVVTCFAATFGYGASIELAQAFTAERTASLLDVLANGIGAIVGVAAAWLVARWLVPQAARPEPGD